MQGNNTVEKSKSRKRRVSSVSKSGTTEKSPNLISVQPDLRVKFYSRVNSFMHMIAFVALFSDIIGWTTKRSNTSTRPQIICWRGGWWWSRASQELGHKWTGQSRSVPLHSYSPLCVHSPVHRHASNFPSTCNGVPSSSSWEWTPNGLVLCHFQVSIPRVCMAGIACSCNSSAKTTACCSCCFLPSLSHVLCLFVIAVYYIVSRIPQ